jgi:alanine racemase
MRPTIAEISLKNLKFNYLNIRKKVKQRPVMAVVKADAYGHGMLKAVEALESLGEAKPFYYGVALLEEGIELRKSKLTNAPILTFSPVREEEIPEYLRFNILPTLSDESQLDILKRYKGKRKLKIHINVDTGMGRLGINYRTAFDVIREVSEVRNVRIDGIYTHFATSDEKNKSFALTQLGRFKEVLSELESENVNVGIVHAANSGAILDLPDAYFDMVRPGISLYGYYPSLETSESIKLKPVMKLVSRITTLRKVRKGESVSYGRIYFAKKNILAATVPVGYADGYNRALSNKGKAIVKGGVVKQIGRVTMDRVLFDVNNAKVKVGSRIVLMGKEGNKNFDAWEWSKILNTIPYEITCNISKRVPRIYVD